MPDAIAVAATPAPAAGLSRRVAVTVGVVAALLAARWIELPLLDPATLAMIAGPRFGRGALLSPVALQLTPFVSAYLLVELVALVHPGLRRLRNGPSRDRLRLTRYAWGAGVLLAVIQGWGIATYLQTVRGWSDATLLEPGLLPRAVVALTLAAGAVVAAWGAVLVSWHGLGNGFAVLLAADAILSLGRSLWSGIAGGGRLGDTGLLAAIALVVVVPLVLARRAREGGGTAFLACGIVPVLAPSLALGALASLSAWAPSLDPAARALQGDGWALVAADVALVAAVALVLARLLSPPRAVAAARGRAGIAGGAEGLDAVDAARAAGRRSVAAVVGVALVPTVAALLGVSFPISADALVALATVIAVAADLRAEARARAASPALVCARPLYRVHAVAPALAALAAAGIPAFARARHYRGLFHLFAPWAPVEILVAPGHAGDAEAICEHVEVGEGAEPLVATSP
jgi:preprotein translocase subunit SecY